jgi:hypothetical protein
MEKPKPDKKVADQTLWTARPDSKTGLPDGARLRPASSSPDEERRKAFSGTVITDSALSKILA